MNSRLKTTFTAALVLLTLAAVVAAQPGPGRGMALRPQLNRPAAGTPESGRQGPAMDWQRPAPNRGGILQLALRRLDLTDEQRQKIKSVIQDGKTSRQTARRAVVDATEALHKAVADGATEADIRQAATTLGTAIGNQAVLRAATTASIKQVLTPEQLEELKKIQDRLAAVSQLGRGPRAGVGARRGGQDYRWQLQSDIGPDMIQPPARGIGRQNRLRMRDWQW